VPLRPDGASFDMAAFRSKVSDRTKLIVLNSPANPTGGVMPRVDVEEVAAIATSADAWVLSDEIYSRLTYDQSEGATSVYSLPDMKERTVLVDGLSKTYCMTGWRLGWAVMPEALAARTELLAVHSYGCVATFTQEAGVAALEGPQDQVDEMAAEYKRRRDFVVSALNAIDGVECPKPAGAFYAFPDVSSFGMTSKQIADLLLNDGGVAVLPGTDFGANGEGKIRLSYVGDMDTLKEGCARISKVLGKLSSEDDADDASKEKKSKDDSSYIITPDSSKGNVGNAMPVIGGGGGGLGANMTWEELDEKVNTYPMDRKFQAIGEGGQSFIDEVVALIEKALGRNVPSGNVTTRPSKKGKYVAVNVTVRLENGNEVLEVYGALKSCASVKWFL
jgi:putative lipoic acid-binding regulatory protein